MAKDLDSFRFTESCIDEAQIRSLYEGSFLQKKSNLIFLDSTDTGKSHPDITNASNLVRRGSRACFYNLEDVANDLEQETVAGRGGILTASLLRFDLAVLDEQGYLPFSKTPASCPFT